jgi:hypothetical protein
VLNRLFDSICFKIFTGSLVWKLSGPGQIASGQDIMLGPTSSLCAWQDLPRFGPGGIGWNRLAATALFLVNVSLLRWQNVISYNLDGWVITPISAHIAYA